MFLLMTYISIFYISCFCMRVVLCSHIERMWASWIVNSGWYAALELAVTLAPLFRITFIASLFARSSFLVIIFVIIFGHHFWWSFLSSFLGKIFWLLHKWIFFTSPPLLPYLQGYHFGPPPPCQGREQYIHNVNLIHFGPIWLRSQCGFMIYDFHPPPVAAYWTAMY